MISKRRDTLRMNLSTPDTRLSVGLGYRGAEYPQNQAPAPPSRRNGGPATDMDYASQLWIFFLLLTGIVIVPGMDMAFVLANALTGGRRAGLVATAGMMVGGAVHTLTGTLAAAGVSRFIPMLQGPMLIGGSLYMMWIGLSLVRSRIVVGAIAPEQTRPAAAIFLQALATCLLNPKAWLFVLAVYPQFIRPDYGAYPAQALLLGAMTSSVQGLVYGGLALMAAKGRDALTGHPSATVAIGRGAGVLLILVGCLTLYRGGLDLVSALG